MIAVSAKRGSVVARHAEASALAALYGDPVGLEGPLTGVLEGLRWARALRFSSLACLPRDAPLLLLDLVSALMAGRRAAPAAFAQTLHGAHPLCALWDTGLAIALGKVLSRGEHARVRDFLTDIGAAAVWFDDADAFANANTRAGLSALEQSH
jgi:molybdopterin-guanine dinucleotide biosynthesis protein A